MKKSIVKLFAFAMIIFFAACTSSKTTSTAKHAETTSKHDERKESNVEVAEQSTNSPTTQLVDLIRRLPGVNIRGAHPNVVVTVRGVKRVGGAESVLYVVDNVPMGNDYSRVAEIVDITRVSSVKALKGGETAIYGQQGDGGVIVIKMKKIRED